MPKKYISDSFVKTGGTNLQILLANGDVGQNATLTEIETGTAVNRFITAESLRLISEIDSLNCITLFGVGNSKGSGTYNTYFGRNNGGGTDSGTRTIAIGTFNLIANLGSDVVAIGDNSGVNNTYDFINLFGRNTTADEHGQTVFSKDGNIMARFSTSLMTATRKWNLPNANGTFALTNNFIDKEIPTGAINGTNTTFTLANTPITGSEHIYRNGILQESGAGNDYTISGSTITYLTAPLTGDKIRVTYRR